MTHEATDERYLQLARTLEFTKAELDVYRSTFGQRNTGIVPCTGAVKLTDEQHTLAHKVKVLAEIALGRGTKLPLHTRRKNLCAAIDALAALAQPAPTAEVALPAVSGETQRLILETARDLLLMEDTPSRSRRRHAGDALDAMLKGNLAEQLPAVSEEAPQGFWLAPNKLSREMIDEMGICGGTYQGWWEGARRAALRLARAQSAAKGDAP